MADVPDVPDPTAHLFPPLAIPPDLEIAAKERGWPDGLLQRVVDLRLPRNDIDWWLGEEAPPLSEIEQWVLRRERLATGTLRARKATVSDNDAFADLWANSSVEIGDWQVTVERSPNAFAQWRLQENVVLNVLEDRGLLVASQGNSRRDTLVGGKRVTVAVMQAVRVRDGFRRLGYSQLVQGGGGGPHPNTPFDTAGYFYIRSQNFTSFDWMRAMNPGMFDGVPQPDGDVPGVDAVVQLIPARVDRGGVTGVRKARPDDLRRCVGLINRTHKGLDLFRPYPTEFLERRLDDGSWSPKPPWFQPVYGWDDFYVLERDGTVVACGGLWDRGRDIREIWRGPDGDVRVVAGTGLMDFGFARGQVAAMEDLIVFLLGQTAEIGRDHLIAPLQFLPSLTKRLARLNPVPDRRGLVWSTSNNDGDRTAQPDPPLLRPYTDLAYW